MANQKEQAKGSGYGPYIYHSIRPGWEQRCGSVLTPSAAPPQLALLQRCPGMFLGRVCSRDMLLRWMQLLPAPSSNAGLAACPQGWDNRLVALADPRSREDTQHLGLWCSIAVHCSIPHPCPKTYLQLQLTHALDRMVQDLWLPSPTTSWPCGCCRALVNLLSWAEHPPQHSPEPGASTLFWAAFSTQNIPGQGDKDQ